MATPKRVQTSRPKFAFSRMDNRKIKMVNKKKLSVYAELSRIPKTTLFTTLPYGTLVGVAVCSAMSAKIVLGFLYIC